MAKNTIAQHEQIFKSLQQSLQEICKQHYLASNSLIELNQANYSLDSAELDRAWSIALNLLVKVGQLRSSNFLINR